MNNEQQPVIYLTRKEQFSAAHRLWSKSLSDTENIALFGHCAREAGHGHNYTLEVTIKGPLNPETGIVVSLTDFRDSIRSLIIDQVDHRNLNVDSPICLDINPTVENLVVLFWNILEPVWAGMLFEIKLFETEKNWAVYRGKY
jgi:6-pyruvoyltetrahydropterin/6-carboxytetrahydropterin synthase